MWVLVVAVEEDWVKVAVGVVVRATIVELQDVEEMQAVAAVVVV